MSWRIWLTILLLLPNLARSEPLRFATWNIENFWHVEVESLRGPYCGRDTIRFAEDYEAIRGVIARLNADVWALQEIGSPETVAFLFPKDEWTLVFSERYSPDADRDIYTVLALTRDKVTFVRQEQIPLGVSRGNHEGTAALIDMGTRQLWVGRSI